MRHFIFCITLLLFPISTLLGQTSVGFSNSDDTKPILDYRLPDWGYSNLMLNVDLTGSNDYSKRQETDPTNVRRNRAYRFFLNPSYEIYRESEKRIFSIQSDLFLLYRNQQNKQEAFDVNESSEADFTSDFTADVNFKRYLNEDLFLIADEEAVFYYEKQRSESELNGAATEEDDRYRRNFSSATRLGFGFGRIRNVTPIIRAMRINERYKVVSDSDLNGDQIRGAADQFTRYQGYQSRYDRPKKYFWEDMNQAVNSLLDQLESYDLFYLQDVLDENIGARYEGWEVSGGGLFNYSNSLNREEVSYPQPELDRSLSVGKQAGAFIGARAFRNTSLEHQWGIEADVEHTYPLDSDSFTKWSTIAQLQLSWLWTVADRILIDTGLNNRYAISKMDLNLNTDYTSWNNHSTVMADAVYFLENQLALNAGVRYNLVYGGRSNREVSYGRKISAISFNAGLKYYFNRNLY